MLREDGLIWDDKKKKKRGLFILIRNGIGTDLNRSCRAGEIVFFPSHRVPLSLALSLSPSLTLARAHTHSRTHTASPAHTHTHTHTQNLSAALCSSQEMNGGRPRELLYLQMTYPDHMMR